MVLVSEDDEDADTCNDGEDASVETEAEADAEDNIPRDDGIVSTSGEGRR